MLHWYDIKLDLNDSASLRNALKSATLLNIADILKNTNQAIVQNTIIAKEISSGYSCSADETLLLDILSSNKAIQHNLTKGVPIYKATTEVSKSGCVSFGFDNSYSISVDIGMAKLDLIPVKPSSYILIQPTSSGFRMYYSSHTRFSKSVDMVVSNAWDERYMYLLDTLIKSSNTQQKVDELEKIEPEYIKRIRRNAVVACSYSKDVSYRGECSLEFKLGNGYIVTSTLIWDKPSELERQLQSDLHSWCFPILLSIEGNKIRILY